MGRKSFLPFSQQKWMKKKREEKVEHTLRSVEEWNEMKTFDFNTLILELFGSITIKIK